MPATKVTLQIFEWAQPCFAPLANTDASRTQNVREMISSPDILPEAKLRLAILYALRYQKLPQNSIPGVIDLLKQHGVPDAEVSMPDRM